MIGPGNAGGEGFARRLNRRQWIDENGDRRLTDAEEMVFAVVLCTTLGMVGSIAMIEGMEAAVGR